MQLFQRQVHLWSSVVPKIARTKWRLNGTLNAARVDIVVCNHHFSRSAIEAECCDLELGGSFFRFIYRKHGM